MTSLASFNDLMFLMCQQISNSQTHLTNFFGLAAYFSLQLDKSNTYGFQMGLPIIFFFKCIKVSVVSISIWLLLFLFYFILLVAS